MNERGEQSKARTTEDRDERSRIRVWDEEEKESSIFSLLWEYTLKKEENKEKKKQDSLCLLSLTAATSTITLSRSSRQCRPSIRFLNWWTFKPRDSLAFSFLIQYDNIVARAACKPRLYQFSVLSCPALFVSPWRRRQLLQLYIDNILLSVFLVTWITRRLCLSVCLFREHARSPPRFFPSYNRASERRRVRTVV